VRPLIADKFRIIEKLGSGAFGEVLLVKDVQAKEKRALKKLDKLSKSAENEFLILRSLNHPNLVRVYDLIKEGDKVYISQEYVQGVSLDKYQDQNPPVAGRRPHLGAPAQLNTKSKYSNSKLSGSWDLDLEILVQICRALAFLHNKGIIHGDIKPGNILIQEPRTNLQDPIVKLIDFGLSKMQKTGWERGRSGAGTDCCCCRSSR